MLALECPHERGRVAYVDKCQRLPKWERPSLMTWETGQERRPQVGSGGVTGLK